MARQPMNPFEKFEAIQKIASGEVPTQVFRDLGYARPEVQAHAFMQDPDVQQQIMAINRQLAAKYEVSREDVVQGLMEAIQDAKLLADPQAQISGWKEIGKMLGYYAPKETKITAQIDHKGQITGRLQSMSTEELLRLANADVIDAEFTMEPTK